MEDHRHCEACGKPVPASLVHSETVTCSLECERRLAEKARWRDTWAVWMLATPFALWLLMSLLMWLSR